MELQSMVLSPFMRLMAIKSQLDLTSDELIEFYAKNSSKVEVINKDGELQYFYFPKLPHHSLDRSSDLIKTFIDRVNRTNSQTKCHGLF